VHLYLIAFRLLLDVAQVDPNVARDPRVKLSKRTARGGIWHQLGVRARELAERARHARPSMSLDVYAHVMPPDEVASERFLALIDA
jgi:hypothetical protein